MKHKWIITPRGKETKYYDCQRCEVRVVACSRKDADSYSISCEIEQERMMQRYRDETVFSDMPIDGDK